MAWSYRQDVSDETYHAPGVHLVEGEKLPDTPASEEHAQEMLHPAEPTHPISDEGIDPKGRTLTQHQEFPGQNVPRFIVGAGETKKDKEIAKSTKKPAEETPMVEFMARERQRIRAEEQNRVTNEELDKERDKIRKEEAENVKKAAAESKKEAAEAHKAETTAHKK
jgi:hypothetical protein